MATVLNWHCWKVRLKLLMLSPMNVSLVTSVRKEKTYIRAQILESFEYLQVSFIPYSTTIGFEYVCSVCSYSSDGWKLSLAKKLSLILAMILLDSIFQTWGFHPTSPVTETPILLRLSLKRFSTLCCLLRNFTAHIIPNCQNGSSKKWIFKLKQESTKLSDIIGIQMVLTLFLMTMKLALFRSLLTLPFWISGRLPFTPRRFISDSGSSLTQADIS